MRIAFDATPLIGPRTGIGWYTAELMAAVAGQAPGDEVIGLPITWRRAGLAELGDNPPANLTVVGRFAPARPLWWMWSRVPWPPLEWLVGCDVFHATNFLAPPTWRVPTVVTVHDVGFARHHTGVDPGVARMAALLPKVLDRASAIVAVSRFTADELSAWLPRVTDRIRVIPGGPRRRPSALTHLAMVGGQGTGTGTGQGSPVPPGDEFALVLGTLEPRKNVAFALDALAVLRARGVKLRLVLAGGTSPLLDVEALMAERDLGADAVIRTGYLADGEVAGLMADASLLVFPSLYEGFGMPLVEAMAAGLPVVAARAGATPETVADAAALVEPGDSAGLADAIEQVAFDETFRADLVARGTKRAAAFSWDHSARATLEVYRQVV
ncbi:MAG: glycosyltransferase family 4 protein [Acidimicrobiales bacterium]